MRDLKYYLNKAQKEKWAIGQFNFSTLEQLRGILQAAQKTKSPVIIGTSAGEIGYLGLEETVALVNISREKYGVEAFLNLDHNKDIELIKKAVDLGFSAVHFDGSHLSLEKNAEYAKKVVNYAHKKNVLVEGEITRIGDKSQFSLTDIGQFVKSSKIDSLAIAVGTKHGFYRRVKIDLARLKEINDQIDSFLVLHGGSGISDQQIKQAIKAGIVKININTELRLIWKKSLIRSLKGTEIKPYNIMPNVIEAVSEAVIKKIKIFKIS